MKVKLLKKEDGWWYVYGEISYNTYNFITCFFGKEEAKAKEFAINVSKIKGYLSDSITSYLIGKKTPEIETEFYYEKGEEVK